MKKNVTVARKRRLTPRIILASSSPRRSKILNDLKIDFVRMKSNIQEIRRRNEAPRSFAVRVSREKALDVSSRCGDGLILGCDTIVVIDGKILGKPRNRSDAVAMLKSLEGRWHKVFSAVSVYDVKREKMVSGCNITKVKFRPMRNAEIDWYVRTGESLDKAGAYGIQELGIFFIEKIEGSFTGVAGLPVELLGTLLRKIGVHILSLVRSPL